jgi:two-component sensor histidine kinase
VNWVRRSILIKFVGLLGLIILAGGVVALLYQRSSGRGLPYRDQFDRGRLSEWQEFGGTWSIVDGALRNDSDERGAKLITGSRFWTDYKAEADVQLLGRGDAGIVIRARDIDEGVDSYSGYYAGLRIDDQSLVLGRAEYGWREFPPIRMPGGVNPNRWYHLTLSAVGCSIEASATALDTGDGTYTSVYDPNCPRSGKIGVRSVVSGGMWRNVMVHRLKDAETFASAPRRPTPSSLYPTSQGPSPRTYGIDLDAELLKNSATSDTGVLPIGNLRLLAVSQPVHASVSGTVTLTSPHVYIQDATAGAEVLFTQETSLKLGDEVEVTGEAHLDGLDLRIENASERSIAGVVPVPALSITPLQAAVGRYDGMFVEVEGRLDSESRSGDPTVRLDLNGGQQQFYAVSNSRETAMRFNELEKDSVLRLRGICLVGSAFTENKVPFALIVRSPDDVEVLSGPPWWTGEHLVVMAIGLLALGFLIHVLYSHADERRRGAVLKERERLAHEMHDTLAQSFAGLDFKLRAIRNRTLHENKIVNVEKLREELQETCDLVRHSHDEARRSLASLRPEVLEKRGLPDALSQVGNRMTTGSSMNFKTEITGQPRKLPVRIADALFRIGQEAISNAVQHSHAKELSLMIDYQRSQLVMVVADDGRGFSPNEESEGFGLTGMRRRAEGINARLQIESNGRGSTITIAAPCSPELFWLFSLSYIRDHRHK